MAEWSEDVPTDGVVELAPDPRALDAIGRNHSFETALADLVDNSIDAGATNVLIQFIRANARLRSLYVVDNGIGMAPDLIDTAMRVGGRRDYSETDLGHFGLGLKAASFSQATSLTVMSRSAGHHAVGRRWQLEETVNRGFLCDIVPANFAEREFAREWPFSLTEHGTIIRWDDVVSFPATDDPSRVETFINRTITAACQHLGLIFHRFLEDERLTVDFEVHDVDTAFTSPPVPVTPLNPFGYSRSGRPDFPKDLVAEDEDVRLTFKCHLWPGKSSKPQFKLSGNPQDHQGLYFYRRDRLLQAGGWVGIHAADRRLQLARVSVDIDNDVVRLFKMNPEKSRVQVGTEFGRLARAAKSQDGTTFDQYLDVAEQVFKTANSRSAKRRTMIHPGVGLPPRVRATITREIPKMVGEAPIDIRWKAFSDGALAHFFEVDRENQTLWLNKRYRRILLGGKHGGLNDLPLVKTLLYLLVESLFEGDYLGPRDKDNIELWQTILAAAALAERQ
ncbi:ATP-binding protein [Saccharomonospora azurea]|uniref:ATP-binding protein n=1 Tax=Saccharomonospora azurea TaxID=40988 RepID=UPI003D8CAC6A